MTEDELWRWDKGLWQWDDGLWRWEDDIEKREKRYKVTPLENLCFYPALMKKKPTGSNKDWENELKSWENELWDWEVKLRGREDHLRQQKNKKATASKKKR